MHTRGAGLQGVRRCVEETIKWHVSPGLAGIGVIMGFHLQKLTSKRSLPPMSPCGEASQRLIIEVDSSTQKKYSRGTRRCYMLQRVFHRPGRFIQKNIVN